MSNFDIALPDLLPRIGRHPPSDQRRSRTPRCVHALPSLSTRSLQRDALRPLLCNDCSTGSARGRHLRRRSRRGRPTRRRRRPARPLRCSPGDDPAAETYVATKRRGCEDLGVDATWIDIVPGASESKLRDAIDVHSVDPAVCGILLRNGPPDHVHWPGAIHRRGPRERVRWTRPDVGRSVAVAAVRCLHSPPGWEVRGLAGAHAKVVALGRRAIAPFPGGDGPIPGDTLLDASSPRSASRIRRFSRSSIASETSERSTGSNRYFV